MTTRYVCDWCYNEFDDREQVASVDVTVGAVNEQAHMCGACAPDHLKEHYPDERNVATDGAGTTPLPGQQRCPDCGRVASGRDAHCPGCGAGLGGGDS